MGITDHSNLRFVSKLENIPTKQVTKPTLDQEWLCINSDMFSNLTDFLLTRGSGNSGAKLLLLC